MKIYIGQHIDAIIVFLSIIPPKQKSNTSQTSYAYFTITHMCQNYAKPIINNYDMSERIYL